MLLASSKPQMMKATVKNRSKGLLVVGSVSHFADLLFSNHTRLHLHSSGCPANPTQDSPPEMKVSIVMS